MFKSNVGCFYSSAFGIDHLLLTKCIGVNENHTKSSLQRIWLCYIQAILALKCFVWWRLKDGLRVVIFNGREETNEGNRLPRATVAFSSEAAFLRASRFPFSLILLSISSPSFSVWPLPLPPLLFFSTSHFTFSMDQWTKPLTRASY